MFYKIIDFLILGFFSFVLFFKNLFFNIPIYLVNNLEKDLWTSSTKEKFIFCVLITLIPAFLLMMTSFTRIIIVFSLLRNAIGIPNSPPNQIFIGLSLFLTFFIMSPVIDKIYNTAYLPWVKQEINIDNSIKRAIIPIHDFMFKQTRKSDILLFYKISKIKKYSHSDVIPMKILLPAFMISELKTAFLIGFTIFIPFLVIDLSVSSILMSLGMVMVPPSTISLPIKLILFVLSDGWNLLITSLSKSFFIS